MQNALQKSISALFNRLFEMKTVRVTKVNKQTKFNPFDAMAGKKELNVERCASHEQN